MSRVVINWAFCISFAVTVKLISAFVFTIQIVQSLYYLNPKFQASSYVFCDCTARFVSNRVGNPEDRFSHNEAHIGTDNTAKMHRLNSAVVVRIMQIFDFITSSSTNLCSIKCNIDIHIIVLSTMI